MNLEEQKVLYEQDNHIAVVKSKVKPEKGWQIIASPSFDGEYYTWRLIHKKHSHILDAFLAGCEVYELHNHEKGIPDYWDIVDFIDTYINYKAHYLAVPNSLDDCYCEATELHYDYLYKVAKQPNELLDFNAVFSQKYYVIFPEGQEREHRSKVWAQLTDSMTQVEFNTQINKWTYCPKDSTNESQSNSEETKTVTNMETIQAPNGTTKFIKPEFDVVLYEEVGGILYGRVSNTQYHWNKYGNCWDVNRNYHKYDLTPAPQPWYESLGDGVLCWVWDGALAKKEEKEIKLVLEYHPIEHYKYKTLKAFHTFALPLTQEEAMKYVSKQNKIYKDKI